MLQKIRPAVALWTLPCLAGYGLWPMAGPFAPRQLRACPCRALAVPRLPCVPVLSLCCLPLTASPCHTQVGGGGGEAAARLGPRSATRRPGVASQYPGYTSKIPDREWVGGSRYAQGSLMVDNRSPRFNTPNISAEMAEALECPICLTLPEGEVHQCNEGHCYCLDCWRRIAPGRRPECRQPVP